MSESFENKIERKIISGYDFVKTLKVAEILKEIGEDVYRIRKFIE